MTYYRLVVSCIFITALQGCSTTCHQTLIDGRGNGHWNAEVRYRVCGQAAGYSIAIYRTDEEAPGIGEGDKEPFKAVYKYGLVEEKQISEPPVKIEWKGEEHLKIRHNTKKNLEDSESLPMIIRADKVYQDVSLEYDPQPVIWK